MPYCERYPLLPDHHLAPHSLLLGQVDDFLVYLVLLHLLNAVQQGAVALVFQNYQAATPHL